LAELRYEADRELLWEFEGVVAGLPVALQPPLYCLLALALETSCECGCGWGARSCLVALLRGCDAVDSRVRGQ
jgi:hypothetical protein